MTDKTGQVQSAAAEGRRRLEAVASGEESYALAIVDVMMALDSLEEILKLEHAVNENAKRIGVKLCREARERIRPPQMLDIVCFSIRDDTDIRDELRTLGVRYISKAALHGWDDLRDHIKKALAHVAEGQLRLCGPRAGPPGVRPRRQPRRAAAWTARRTRS